MGSTGEPLPWQQISQTYRNEAAAKIPKEWLLKSEYTTDVGPTSSRSVLDVPAACGILTERELEITERYDAVALIDKLAKGELSSLDVTTAFCKRAAIAQQLTFCLTETFFDQALERAKYCDEYLEKHKKPIGPLHGLPISIKDSFNVKGVKSTLGFISFIDNPAASQNSPLVTTLLDLGAVLYVKTNVPQSLMTGDSENNLFLRVLNPNKLCLGAGGSSGGEGALVRFKGCPIGVGTDIAGSIRIPAYVNGAFGLRPTARRVPEGGQSGPGRPGNFSILSVAGPLARSVRDIQAFMNAVLSYDVWNVDESVISTPWRPLSDTSKSKSKLTIGYITDDSRMPLHPTILRTIKTAVKNLSDAGHELIPLDEQLPPRTLNTAMESAFSNFLMDPAKTGAKNVTKSGEPFVASIATASLPELKHFKPDLEDVWRLNVERRKYLAMFRELYVKNDLDVILMPTYQSTAVRHDRYGVPMYTVLANLLDVRCCTLPIVL
jgi:amidase